MQLTVNGKATEVPDAQGDDALLWVLHDTLQLNGARYGCGAGFCGSCTVLLDGEAVRSCQMKAREAVNKQLTTLEGLAVDGKLHPVQQAFAEHPLQCCYCMTGHILTAAALLEKTPNPDAATIDETMTVNLCRCGGYNNIRANVLRAAALKRGEA